VLDASRGREIRLVTVAHIRQSLHGLSLDARDQSSVAHAHYLRHQQIDNEIEVQALHKCSWAVVPQELDTLQLDALRIAHGLIRYLPCGPRHVYLEASTCVWGRTFLTRLGWAGLGWNVTTTFASRRELLPPALEN